jgi:hypothetical protein
MEVAQFFQWLVVRVEDELLALEVLVEMIHSPDCGRSFE